MSEGGTAEGSVEGDRAGGSPSAETDDASDGIDPVALAPQLALVALYLVTILAGLALVDEMLANEIMLFQDETDVGNVGVFAALVLGFTAVLLLAFRYGVSMALLRVGLTLYFGLLVGTVFGVATGIGTVAGGSSLLAGLPTSPVPIAVGLLSGVILLVYPEWYLLDLAAVVVGAAVIPMIGLGFGPLPIVVLLVVWAGYDAYSVYVSGHMQELASGLGDLKLPFVFVVPRSLSYSMVDDGLDLGLDDDEDADAGEDGDDASEETDGDADDGPDVALLGLGDAIIPGMLAVSAGQYLDAPTVVPALNANLPAIGAVLGGLVGMAALTYLVHRVEGAHAGLPPLNAGVLAGYLVGAVAAGIPVTAALGL
jgi:presenilin-like A22 family membrane protease